MQGFCVSTTGIYCLPGCSAPIPRAEDVGAFPLAAAAEAAGYQACPGCRPYRSPPTLDWSGPELVCRAVRLIFDGALDRGTEAEFAHRLGVSARHLRRLFTAELGVTPDGLARSARAHFARRLLDETDLSMTEIAFAAGFGSLRQFNRVLQQVFGESPRVLRSKRRTTDRLAADGGLSLRLTFHGRLDWPSMIRYFDAQSIAGVEHVDGETYRRTIVVDGDPGVLELSVGGADHLILRAHLPHWLQLIHIVARARLIANLDFNPDPAGAQLQADKALGPLITARQGVRPPGTWDPFETGIRALISQRRGRSTVNKIIARIVEQTGSPVPGLEPLGLSHTFPTSATLATANLDGLGIPSTLASAIRRFAVAVNENSVQLDRSASLDRLVADLTSVNGFGASAAHYLALRLGEPDAFPLTELELRRALPRLRTAPAPEISRATKRWHPWRAVATAYVWGAEDVSPRRLASHHVVRGAA